MRMAGDRSTTCSVRPSCGRSLKSSATRAGDLMAMALAEGGKTLAESDPEVSEAVDFVEFYRRTACAFRSLPGVEAVPRGVVVVVSPWNFPIAIPCGGVAAALAAGNTVILKPASDTVLVAHALCECFWRAGVSRKTLQLVPCAGATGGRRLVSHDDVDVVILTGGTDTAVQHAARQAAPAVAGRDRGQERHHRHDHFRPRPGDQARPAFGVQPRRTEVFRHIAADPGRRGVS